MADSISKTLHGLMAADAPISALVGDRISPYLRNSSNASDFPAIVYELQTTDIETTSIGEIGRCTTGVRVSALSRDYETADQITNAVLNALCGYSDSTDCIAKISPVSVEHTSEVPYDGSQDLIYITSATIRVFHGEPI